MGKIYVERESSYGDVSATMSQSLVIKRFPTQLSVSVRYSMKKEFDDFFMISLINKSTVWPSFCIGGIVLDFLLDNGKMIRHKAYDSDARVDEYKDENGETTKQLVREEHYIISKEEFKTICNSETISIRTYKSNGTCCEFSMDRCEKLLQYFRVFYRDAIDKNSYPLASVSQLNELEFAFRTAIVVLSILGVIGIFFWWFITM